MIFQGKTTLLDECVKTILVWTRACFMDFYATALQGPKLGLKFRSFVFACRVQGTDKNWVPEIARPRFQKICWPILQI